MDSLTFTPGRAFLSSNSPAVPWTAVFEDEGNAGYFYACDRSQQTQEHSIMDSMLIYNKASLPDPDGARGTGDKTPLASIQWSRSGQQCVLYLDGTAQAYIDFATRTSFCRSNFPNYLAEQGDMWRKASHAWEDATLQRFESELYT